MAQAMSLKRKMLESAATTHRIAPAAMAEDDQMALALAMSMSRVGPYKTAAGAGGLGGPCGNKGAWEPGVSSDGACAGHVHVHTRLQGV